MSRRRRSRNRVGYLFAAPWLIGFLLLTAGPMVISLGLSFVEWDGVRLEMHDEQDPKPGQIRWVGLRNFTGERGEDGRVTHVGIATDPDVGLALWNTLYYTALAVPLSIAAALVLAVLLNQKLRGMNLFRTLFYMPHVIGGVATIMMWMWVFHPEAGLLNSALRVMGEPLVWVGVLEPNWHAPTWIYSARWSKPALIIMSVWGSGGAMLIFLAALQNVPEQLYEAARIDGAGRWGQFWHVTVPQISPAILFNLIMGMIGSFQVFNEAYIMTGEGSGGPSKSLLFYVLYLYNTAFRDFEMGYASALAWLLFAIIMVFTLVTLGTSKKWVYYEGEAR